MQENTGSKATSALNIPSSDAKTAIDNVPAENQGTTLLDSESPSEDFDTNPPAQLITKEKYLERKQEDAEHTASLEARNAPMPATGGNPAATVADPLGVQVQPRYDVVQNRSNLFLIIPDLKSEEDDRGAKLLPGEVIKLTDFYSPQQINRSRGLRYSSTELKGLDGNFALVPLANEEQGANFTPPEKKELAAGTTVIDNEPNDFDIRFEELEAKEKKREEKLKKKSLGMRKSSQHGSVNNV